MTDEPGSQGAFAAEPPSQRLMNESASDEQAEHPGRKPVRWRRRITLLSLLIVVLAAALVLPPLINIGRYQHEITALMSRSLGRPVRLSGVELRLLPSPGFVLHDLSVSEDPSFGAEPVLSARTVVASIRIPSLWQGKLVVNRISVDEASLNLVRSPQGRWNLESLMRGGLTGKQGGPAPAVVGTLPGFSRKPAPFPYLEATNSRVNLKNGAEKSPFSLVGADLSLWQDEPGAWRLRLRGQPVRTDMEMSLGDTGQVQVEASLQASSSARELREMPLKLQAEWRDAQLGQLSRLLLGSDAGWRGDLRADLDVQGTPDTAQTKARLRATGVRREEFAPETPLDFDANCNFLYQHSQNAVRGLGCDTAIGDGLLHLKADLPGDSGNPEAMLEVKQIPLQAGLDLLRTLRSGFAPGIVAQGAANGSLSLMTVQPVTKSAGRHGATTQKTAKETEKGSKDAAGVLSLQGALTVEGGVLKGGALQQPLVLPKMTLAPLPASNSAQGDGLKGGLSSLFSIAFAPVPSAAPAATRARAPVLPNAGSSEPSQSKPGQSKPGESKPVKSTQVESKPVSPKSGPVEAAALTHAIAVALALTPNGYEAAIKGSAETSKLRELAYAFGMQHLDAVDSMTGGTVDLTLTAAGPWIDTGQTIFPLTITARQTSLTSQPNARAPLGSDSITGVLQIHHAQWKAPYLARPVDLPQGTVNLFTGGASMTSEFGYGVLKGSVTVRVTPNCGTADCPPEIQLHLGAVDVSDMEAALLGAPEKKTLLSPLIDRMRSSERPKWPSLIVDVQADSLVLGPTTLRTPSVRLRLKEREISLDGWEARLMDGSAKGTGRFAWAGDKPEYSLDGEFTQLSAASLGEMLDTGWSAGPVSGSGSIQLSGFTNKELAASASGSLKFQWLNGAIRATVPGTATTGPATEAAQQVTFHDWSGTVAIQGGKAQLGENHLASGKQSSTVTGGFTFDGPVKLVVEPQATPHKRADGQPVPKPTDQSGPQPAAPPAVK